jgi:hypothetical protein
MTVHWVILKEKRFGLVKLDYPPSYVMNMLQRLPLSPQLRLILFASKADSVAFENKIRKAWGQPEEDRIITAKSRYTVFFRSSTDPTYILLNVSAIDKSTAGFLTSLLSNYIDELKERHGVIEADRKLLETLALTFYSYPRKMEIPFVYADEMALKLVHVMAQNIQLSYLECLALRRLLNTNKFNDLAEYLTYKAKLGFESLDYEMRFQLPEVYHVLEIILQAAIFLSAVSDHRPLAEYMSNVFWSEFGKFKTRYSELPDALRASELILSRKHEIRFSSYEDYVTGISQLFETAFRKIEARYGSLGEGIALVKLSEFYLNALDAGVFVIHEEIGSIDNYIELLKRVFKKEGTYPEVRILAGMALSQTLLTWTMMDHNLQRFAELVSCTKQFCKLVIRSLPEIRKKNGTVSGFTGSPLTYEDALLNVLSISSLARSLGDSRTERELLKYAERTANRYDVPSIRFHLWWGRFVALQDFRYLSKLHEITAQIDFKRFSYLENTIRSLDLFAQAIIYREDVELRLRLAQELMLDDVSKTTGQNVHVVQSIQHTGVLYLVFEMFKHILLPHQTPSSLRKAYIASLALENAIAKADRLNLFVINTKLLYKLVTNDFAQASQLRQEAAKFADRKGKTKAYLDYVERWIDVCNRQNQRRRYVYQKDFHYEGDDIWVRALQSHIQKTMETDLDLDVSGCTAIVFVEGETDEFVFREFSGKICPGVKVSFLDIEGYTNYRFYVEAKITNELRIPLYLIFDGDTRAGRKESLENQFAKLSIGKRHVYTLKGNSVENYLLNPNAIKKAYPDMRLSVEEIQGFLQKNRNKRNKKNVLDTLFRLYGLGSYNKNAARHIAHRFKKDEIDIELVQIISKIGSLVNLD